MCVFTHTYTHTQRKKEMLITNIVIISATGHMAVIGIYIVPTLFYYLLLSANISAGSYSLSGGITQTIIPKVAEPLAVISELGCYSFH